MGDIYREIDKNEFQALYERVFSSNLDFQKYFYTTPDLTKEEAFQRVNLIVKRLYDSPEEQFSLIAPLPINNKEISGNISLQNLIPCIDQTNITTNYNRLGRFYLNGLIASFIEGDREDYFNNFLLKARLQDRGIILSEDYFQTYSPEPKLKLDGRELINSLSNLGLPLIIKPFNEGIFQIETPNVSFNLIIKHNEAHGDYFVLEIPTEPLKITAETEKPFEECWETIMKPQIVMNAINSLVPSEIVKKFNKNKKRGISENVFLRSNHLRRDSSSTTDYFAPTFPIEFPQRYAQSLGWNVESGENYNEYFTELPGWFFDLNELKEVIFMNQNLINTEVNSNNSNTFEKILQNIASFRYPSQIKEFLQNVQIIQSAYRAFLTEDNSNFIFPEGYQPFAVTHSGEFAMGIKQQDMGLDICFQLSSFEIHEQLENRQLEIQAQLDKLEFQRLLLLQEQQDLDTLKKSYILQASE